MGAKIESDDGTPPLAITGGRALRCINYEMPIASAQVKSAVLIAGLYASGITHVTEPAVTRDHTERMLRTLGAEVDSTATRISVQGRPTLIAQDMQIPGDLSSATFLMLAAILAEGAEVVIESVGVNPTRTGVVDILQAMGADITLQNHRQFGEEPVADIHVRSSSLKGIAVEPSLVSLAIDEFPALFVAAGAASGKTTFSGIAELRVKESDRIAAMATGLRSLGIDVDELHDGAIVHGGRYHGGSVESFGDHRIAMSLAVAGTVAADAVIVKDVASVNTSFPGFVDSLSNLGTEIVESTQERP
jgi:3-phosphoshikimate 1-carboxyvinyltransferase